MRDKFCITNEPCFAGLNMNSTGCNPVVIEQTIPNHGVVEYDIYTMDEHRIERCEMSIYEIQPQSG